MGTIIELFGRHGRRDSFEALVAPHINLLFRQAYRFTGNQNDAEDLLQDLMLQIYPRRSELDKIKYIRAWLIRSLYHRFIDNFRHRSNDPLTSSVPDDESLEWVSAADSAEQPADNALLRKQLSLALKQLNPKQRAVVVLHDMEGYTLEELHTLLDSPVGTLKSRLHRARQHLRANIKMEPFLEDLRSNS